MPDRELDLGTLLLQRAPPGVIALGAPGLLTRATWLLGSVGSLIFLWSVAVTLGWLQVDAGGTSLVRLPDIAELFFWLVPLLMAVGCLALAAGGVRVVIAEAGLELKHLWPGRGSQKLPWEALRRAQFWCEETRNHELLYAIRFAFADVDVLLRIANEPLWKRLRERFSDP